LEGIKPLPRGREDNNLCNRLQLGLSASRRHSPRCLSPVKYRRGDYAILGQIHGRCRVVQTLDRNLHDGQMQGSKNSTLLFGVPGRGCRTTESTSQRNSDFSTGTMWLERPARHRYIQGHVAIRCVHGQGSHPPRSAFGKEISPNLVSLEHLPCKPNFEACGLAWRRDFYARKRRKQVGYLKCRSYKALPEPRIVPAVLCPHLKLGSPQGSSRTPRAGLQLQPRRRTLNIKPLNTHKSGPFDL
jgi:hypothetical protein